MSLLQELGAQLRATSDELPTGQVTVALERLRSAADLLNWVRQTSHDPLGVPELGNATEHAEHVIAALRLAQDAIEAYLAVLGLGADAGGPPPDRDYREGLGEKRDHEAAPPPERKGPPEAPPPPGKLGRWWQERVEKLTGEAPPPPEEVRSERTGPGDLLRRVAAGVRSGDRAKLGRDLHAVQADTGLGLSAVTSPVLRRLATDLLGHPPRPEDVPRLRNAVAARVRSLLPGTPPAVLDTLLNRICRAPQRDAAPDHPADAAVTSSVLTGVLLARLGRDAATLEAETPEPARPSDPAREDSRRSDSDRDDSTQDHPTVHDSTQDDPSRSRDADA